ncbi:MAG TPA: hemerythrin domain-containing protein [Candidatus Binatia bacterium]|jgi:hemerythrin-like domain-containing protein|nr:hemerythrin domain-containing protein [Candidatus Binatia bacterium]
MALDVTDALAGEHGVLHFLLAQLEEAAARATSTAELRPVAETVALALLAHQRVEDETMLAPYERATGSLGPLRCLAHEHEQMDHGLRVLVRLADLDHARTHVTELAALVRRHLAREEQLLFGVVREALPEAERHVLGARWAALRGLATEG